jgi:hypothetical protein
VVWIKTPPLHPLSDPAGVFFDLPEVTVADDAFLKSHPSPTFEQQIAHARWLLALGRSRGIPDAHSPRQLERFEM